MSVKVKNAVSATYLMLFYNTKNRLHFCSQYIEFNPECDGSVSEIPAYTETPYYCSVFFLSDHHTVRITFNIGLRGRRRHEIQCQLRQSLVAGLAIEQKLYGTLCLKWSSVLELCCVMRQIRMQTLPLRAHISLTSWYIPIKIANATQFVVR